MGIQKKNNQAIGMCGEEIAVRYLHERGFCILARNYVYRENGKAVGEIDVVAKKDTVLHIVEVKTRRVSGGYQELPEARVTQTKLRALRKTISAYRREHRDGSIREISLDVCSILYDEKKRHARVRFIPHVFLT